jgi:putative transposase
MMATCGRACASWQQRRRFRVLNIVDDVTRECLRAVVDTSISGRRVVRELGDLIVERARRR